MRKKHFCPHVYQTGLRVFLACLLAVPIALTKTPARTAHSSSRSAMVTSTVGDPVNPIRPTPANLTAAQPASEPTGRAAERAPKPAVTPGRVKPMASGATIIVTPPDQKPPQQVGGPGCSLVEAIYAANFDDNIAIDSINPDGTDHFVTTNCLAGAGDDTIVLPAGAVFQMSRIIDDTHNYMGPTGTPIIFSNITISGNGSRLEHTGNLNFRAFSVGSASVDLNPGGSPNIVSGTGTLTVNNAHIKGFSTRGGNGASGGGGGLGAGGAIYVQAGSLTVENSTFEANVAIGGNGSARDSGGGGGGGGLSGNGGQSISTGQIGESGGGGGGGSRGNGGIGGFGNIFLGGGGGGGTLTGGKNGDAPIRSGGFKCGGGGADPDNNQGADGACSGGGGGGGSAAINNGGFDGGGDGGKGNYGGGGGGAGEGAGASGGDGGFGGGGGATNLGTSQFTSPNGGHGGFGGGGGGAADAGLNDPGAGGPFGGMGDGGHGGGGGALGGAIFNDSGTVEVRNCTFFGNDVSRGVSGGGVADNGADAGGAIFSRNGSLLLLGSTISGNLATGSGGGVVVVNDGATASFVIRNTIIANNGAQECFFTGTVTNSGSGNLIVQNFGCPGMVSMDDPQLGPLQLNDPGLTPTMAIGTTSPAFNAGDDNNCITHDQRGVARPQFNNCDIGAYEVRPCAITCPANITAPNDPNQCGAIVNYPAPSTSGGDCGAVACSPPSGSFFPVGTTTVTCTAAGGSCSFTVTVVDTQAPTITCPPDMTANTGGGNIGSVVVNYPTPVASDNCPGVTVQCTPPSGSTFFVGTTTVTCTATDAAGNKTSCTFQVTVFNTALQSSQSPDSLQWNAKTGDYLFTHCGADALTLKGKGTVGLVNNIRTLTDSKPDRHISATLSLSQLTGQATVMVTLFPGVYRTFFISQTSPQPVRSCR